MPIDYEKIKRLISLVERNGLTELAVEEDGLSVTIKAEPDAPDGAALAMPAVHLHPGVKVQHPVSASDSRLVHRGHPAPEAPPGNLVNIESPMVGVFYRRPSPDSKPYIDVGDEIEEGQTVGLIEAMKVFSEVPSEAAGRVVAVPAESGKLVHEGDVLVVVDTSETSE